MLSPFSLKPKASVSGAADALRGVWTTANGPAYTAWLADAVLAPQQRSAGAATFSDQWYRDRSTMLRWMMKANEQNIDHAANSGFLIDSATVAPIFFQDCLTQTSFTVAAQNLPLGTPGVARVIFGASDADAIAGGDADDFLYGGGGDDTISGYEGKDYIEGNAGVDVLDGGVNDDTLLGGSGNDTLIGGGGADRLFGGPDYDRYVYLSGQGRDTVVDSDGKGQIDWDGITLTGGVRLGENFWLGEQGFTYSLSVSAGRQTLYIGRIGAPGQIVVENFSRADNDLSIQLSDTPRTKSPSPTSRTMLGDFQFVDGDPGPGIQLVLDDLGNALRTQVPEPGKQDFFNDSAGNDLIRSGGGADYIKAFGGGNDDIDAGDGVDGISAGDGDDWITGGNDADELAGGNGSDMIFGGSGDDVILAEDDFADDSATLRLPIGPGVEEIRWWTYDGRFAASGYGISVVRYTFEGITFETPWPAFYAFREHHDPSAVDFVDAGDGADLVHGGDGSDLLFGGAGSDRIEGSAGDDYVDGGSGNDQLMGDAPISLDGPSARPVWMNGNDQVFGGTGDDLVMGGNGSDMLDGGEGDDVLYGDVCGVDTLLPLGVPGFSTAQAAMPNDDVLTGGAGNDRLYGEFGDDVLIGGTGDDQLDGGTGNDIYEYTRGDGADTITAGDFRNETDELRFGAAIEVNDIALTKVGADLVVDTGGPGDVITLKGWFTPGAERQLGRITFADGAVWSRDDINASFVTRQTGTNGADVVRGSAGRDEVFALSGADDVRTNEGDDLIEGGLGNDYLDGGPGSDRYVFRAGDGNDTIAAGDVLGNDVLQFVGIRREDATLSRVGDALVISANGGLDKVTLSRYFELSYVNDGQTVSGVQTIEFEGGVRMSVFDVRALFQTPINGTPGNDYLAGGSADEAIAAGAGNDIVFANGGNDTLFGGDGNDSLDAGVGADVLDGGPGDDLLLSRNVIDASRPSYLPVVFLNNGDDTFVFGRGYGHDSVEEDNPGATSTDTVLLKDLLPTDVAFGRGDAGTGVGSVGDVDLIIRVRTSGDTLRLARFFDPDPRFWVEQIRFADGSVWSRDRVLASLSSDGTATVGSDYLLGGPEGDVVQAGGGNDIVWLGDGNDVAYGEDGDDHLQGGAGNDVLSGGAGNDRVFGGIGSDILDGGAGNDDLYGGLGPNVTDSASDTYIFRRGGGRDVVRDTRSSGDSDLVYLDGLGASDVELGWTADGSLRIRVIDTGDALIFDQHFVASSPNKLEWIRFADGALYDAATIERLARPNMDEYLTGTSANDVIDGGGGNDQISGGPGDDTLRGGTGDDTLIGDAGADSMDGGLGNDLFFVDSVGDVVTEASGGGTDRISSSISSLLPANVENLTLTGTLAINGTGNALDNVLVGNSASNRLDGGAGNDSLNGGAGIDTMLGGAGDDTYTVDNASDVVTENANEGTDLVIASVSRTLGANQEHLTLSGASAINGTGNTLNNAIKGNAGNNTLNGAAGTDVLQGGAGNDVLTDTSGRGVHDGGDGADALTGGTDRQFFAGGAGDDTFTPGGGADVIAFNRGHGADSVNAPTTGTGLGERNDVISLAGVSYGELRFARDVNDLVLRLGGAGDSVRLKGWYAASGNQTVSQLQVIVDTTSDYDIASSDTLRNKRIARFDFAALVVAFNSAGSPNDWSIPPAALRTAYSGGSDTDAVGGQLAYRYARDGNLTGIDFGAAVGVLSDTAFGTSVQAIGGGPTSGGVPLSMVAGVSPVTQNVADGELAPAPTAASTDLRRGTGWATGQPVARIVLSADFDAVPTRAEYLAPEDLAVRPAFLTGDALAGELNETVDLGPWSTSGDHFNRWGMIEQLADFTSDIELSSANFTQFRYFDEIQMAAINDRQPTHRSVMAR